MIGRRTFVAGTLALAGGCRGSAGGAGASRTAETGFELIRTELGQRARLGVAALEALISRGYVVDTMEVASSWERLMDLYHSVRTAIGRHAVVMAHFSHAYADGCSIYFTVAGHAPDAGSASRIYDAIWRDGLEAATRVGATISHQPSRRITRNTPSSAASCQRSCSTKRSPRFM